MAKKKRKKQTVHKTQETKHDRVEIEIGILKYEMKSRNIFEDLKSILKSFYL